MNLSIKSTFKVRQIFRYKFWLKNEKVPCCLYETRNDETTFNYHERKHISIQNPIKKLEYDFVYVITKMTCDYVVLVTLLIELWAKINTDSIAYISKGDVRGGQKLNQPTKTD